MDEAFTILSDGTRALELPDGMLFLTEDSPLLFVRPFYDDLWEDVWARNTGATEQGALIVGNSGIGMVSDVVLRVQRMSISTDVLPTRL